MAEKKDGWAEWSIYVIKTLEKLDTKVDLIEKSIEAIRLDVQLKVTQTKEQFNKDIFTLKLSAGIWGTVGGFIVSAVISLVVGYVLYNITKG